MRLAIKSLIKALIGSVIIITNYPTLRRKILPPNFNDKNNYFNMLSLRLNVKIHFNCAPDLECSSKVEFTASK